MTARTLLAIVLVCGWSHAALAASDGAAQKPPGDEAALQKKLTRVLLHYEMAFRTEFSHAVAAHGKVAAARQTMALVLERMAIYEKLHEKGGISPAEMRDLRNARRKQQQALAEAETAWRVASLEVFVRSLEYQRVESIIRPLLQPSKEKR
jgi:hypothetical protein